MPIQPSQIKLIQTCGACPEQYDAELDMNRVGYLRLRWGGFNVTCPGVVGESVYYAEVGDDMCGQFPSPGERKQHLDLARKAIAEYVNRKLQENIDAQS